jgi:methylisocitrate lyase
MKKLSRREFGKAAAAGAVGGLAAGSVTPLAGRTGGSSSVKQTTTVLRELIKGPGLTVAPGCYDPLGARMAEDIGFRCLDLPGNALGKSLCIVEPAVSLEDVAEATRRITSVVRIPVVVDVGAGYGEAAHVYHTVQAMEHAGAAGMHMEDQVVPKRFSYHKGVEETISAEAMVDKIKAAVEGRRDPDFVIIARTDTVRTKSYAEAVRRSNLFLEAGADMAMLYPVTLEDIKRTPKEVHGPVNWGYSTKMTYGEGECPSFEDLEAWGYKVLNFAHVPELQTMKAQWDSLVHLKETRTVRMDRAVYEPFVDKLFGLTGLPIYLSIEAKSKST